MESSIPTIPHHKKLERSNSHVISKPEVNFPTKKLRMRSLLWVKPKGVAISSTSSFIAQLLPTLIVNLAALSSGIAMGYSAILLPQLNEKYHQQESDGHNHNYQPFTIDDGEGSWIASLFGLGAVFGGAASAAIGSYLGRRRCLLLMIVPFVIGWVLIASAQHLIMLLLGRLLTGFAAGGSLPAIQTYVAEIAQPQHRGTLAAITIPAITLGTFMSYCLGAVISWHYVAIFALVIPIIMIPGLLLISNSPYWYLQMGDEKQAVQAMERFRSSDANGLSELLAIADVLKGGQHPAQVPFKETLHKLFQRGNRRPFIILSMLMLLMRFSGSYAISFYAVDIFRTAAHGHVDDMHDYVSAIIIGAIKLVASLAFIPAVGYFPRKLLLCSTSVIMGFALSIMGLAMSAQTIIPGGLPHWLPLLCVTVYMAVEPLGLGSIPFIYMAEFFAAEVRALLCGLTMAFSYLELFVAVKTFPTIGTTMGDGVPFWIYGGVCLLAVVFTLLFVPETKNKSLEDIEKFFRHKESLHVTPFTTPYSSPIPLRKSESVPGTAKPYNNASVQFTL